MVDIYFLSPGHDGEKEPINLPSTHFPAGTGYLPAFEEAE